MVVEVVGGGGEWGGGGVRGLDIPKDFPLKS